MRLHAGMSLRVVLIVAAVIGALAFGPQRAAAAPLTEFNLPTGATASSLIDGPDGALYFAETTSAGKAEIGRITTGGTITSTPPLLTTGDVSDLADGAGGTIWFSIAGTDHAIGKLTPAGQVTLFGPGTNGLNMGAVPVEMSEGANGAVWFIDHGTTKAIGKITPSGSIVEYPTGGDDPDALTNTANGDAWFTVQGPPGQIGTVAANATPGSNATLYPTGSMTMPTEITAGGEGDVWFSDDGMPPAVGRITPGGASTEFGSADGLQMNADPDALTAGPDGNVWFQDQYGNNPAVGRVTPAGAIKEYPLAHEAWDITTGIDRDIWLATGDNGGTNPGVARVIPATGQIRFFSAGLGAGAVVGDGSNIVSGPDGNLWLIDIGTPYAIVRADVQLPPTATTGAASSVTNASAHIAGTANPRGSATTVAVQYGTTPSLGSTVAAGSLAVANRSSPVSATLAGLAPGTVVYYRVRATNAYGSATGSTRKFTTTGTRSPTRTVHATVGNRRITVTLPSAKVCLAPGAKLRVKVSSAAIAKSKAAKLRFRKVGLYVGRGVRRARVKVVGSDGNKHRRRVTVYVANATATHLPATLAASLHGLKPGPHPLRVRLSFVRTRHRGHHAGHVTVIETIKVSFRVC